MTVTTLAPPPAMPEEYAHDWRFVERWEARVRELRRKGTELDSDSYPFLVNLCRGEALDWQLREAGKRHVASPFIRFNRHVLGLSPEPAFEQPELYW